MVLWIKNNFIYNTVYRIKSYKAAYNKFTIAEKKEKL